MTVPNLPIQRIEIIGLHNDRDISLDFDAPIKILVDENGSGKTTFLNLLIGILQGDLQKIRRYDFESIEVIFSDTETLIFERSDIEGPGFFNLSKSDASSRLSRKLMASVLDGLKHGIIAHIEDSDALHIIGVSSDSTNQMKQLQAEFHNSDKTLNIKSIDDRFKEKSALVSTYFPYQILYFPTYRLVEENLHTLGYEKSDIDSDTELLIQFGMEDIRNQWNRITQEMRNTSIDGFSRVNGHMLDELTEEIDPQTIHYDKIEDETVLALVLSRSGDSVTEKSRQRILELVRSEEIRNEKFEPLAYFLSNLITIHEAQKETDDLINNFARVVNGYLRDKEISYNASALSLQVVSKHDRVPIGLDKLSSGEKQIVSIFSKLFLDFDPDKPFAVFIDEPELSLSMEWQEKLLKDIIDSKHIAFLCAATHSPFIYEGELLDYTDVLNVKMTEEKNGSH